MQSVTKKKKMLPAPSEGKDNVSVVLGIFLLSKNQQQLPVTLMA